MGTMRPTLLIGLLLALSALPAVAQPSARILDFEGDVQLKKHDSTAWRPINDYDFILQAGDSLRTGAASRLTLLYNSGKTATRDAHTLYRIIDEAAHKPIIDRIAEALYRLFHPYETARPGAPRGGDKPVLIAPRYGKVLHPRPAISWIRALPDSIDYRYDVLVETASCDPNQHADSLVWKRTDVEGTHLAYPAEAPDLHDGQTYALRIGRAAQLQYEDFGCFTVATADERAAAQEARNAIRAAYRSDGPDAPTADLLYAAWLVEHDFCAEALALLEEAPLKRSRSPARVYLLTVIFNEAGPRLLVPSPHH